MNKVYEEYILKVLAEVGDGGISIQKLAMHVYNMSCTLFSRPDFLDVRSFVRQYVRRNTGTPQSLIESAGHRGLYRLNTSRSIDAFQLMLEFREQPGGNDISDARMSKSEDQSLDLF